ncbi:acyl carrier protein [Micromonospora sp. NPDC050417]|uniref:acyl carrier protein n=1 Tax=Micromonospora sp. NPDC050417 TaxID=3364280 RepID=UPI0037A8EEF9
MDRDVFEVVDELFRRRLQVPELDPDTPLADYGLDSVRSIELIVEMESVFDVEISDEQAASIQTLRDVAAQVAASRTVRAGTGSGEA